MAKENTSKQPIPGRVIAAVLFTVFVLAVFGLTALIDPGAILPGAEVNEAVESYAQYFAGRQLVLALGLIALLALREVRMLGYFLIVNGLVQSWDGILGIVNGETALFDLMGPILLAVIDFWAAYYLLRRSPSSPSK